MAYFLTNLIDYEGPIGGQHATNGSPTEDGNHTVAEYIFQNIGIKHNFVLDIGAMSYKASNVITIADKYKTDMLLLDGVNKYNDPVVKKEWLTADNITSILEKYNCPKNMDYLSIDIDNMDYWILESVLKGGYRSNLIILEFNPIWDAMESYTKRNIPKAHKADDDTAGSSNYGASLLAFTKLLNHYGYRLIHVMKQNAYGDLSSNNAFFILNEFDTKNHFINQDDIIQMLHPIPFVEYYKLQNNLKRFGTVNISEIKKQLISQQYVIEV